MATANRSTVIAVYGNNSDAQGAAAELQANGFSARDILVTSADTAATVTEAEKTDYGTHHEHEGGITGWFKSLFEHHHESDEDEYQNAVRKGNVLLSVETDDDKVEAVGDVLDRFNPIDIHREDARTASTTASASAGDTAGAAGTVAGTTAGRNYGAAQSTAPPATTGQTTAARAASAGAAANTAAQTAAAKARTAATNAANTAGAAARTDTEGRPISVVEEELQVGKRRVLRGGVRVYSRVVERPVEETVRLREETVRVDREKVNRPVTQADLRPGREEVIEVKEFAEEPVVAKQARVVEEVRVQKDARERDETIRDTVRHTEVRVEGINAEAGGATGTGVGVTDYDEDYRRDFQTNYATSGAKYEDYAPAYRYGYDIGNDPRYRNRSFEDIESDLRTDYAKRYPTSAWDRFKNSIRYGWDRATGRTRAASSR